MHNSRASSSVTVDTRQHQLMSSGGPLSYVYCPDDRNTDQLFRGRLPNELRRPILVDGYSVARNNDRRLDVRRLLLALRYFYLRGHQAKVYLIGYYACVKPRSFNEWESVIGPNLLDSLKQMDLIEFVTTSNSHRHLHKLQRNINLQCQIVAKSREIGGLLCSRSNFSAVLETYPDYEDTIKHRVLPPTFADNDTFYLPLDGPLGRNGVGLNMTLRCDAVEATGSRYDASVRRFQLSLEHQYAVLKELEELLGIPVVDSHAEQQLLPILNAERLQNFTTGSAADCHEEDVNHDIDALISPPVIDDNKCNNATRTVAPLQQNNPVQPRSTVVPRDGFVVQYLGFSSAQCQRVLPSSVSQQRRDIISSTVNRNHRSSSLGPATGMSAQLRSYNNERQESSGNHSDILRQTIANMFSDETAERVISQNPTVTNVNTLIDLALTLNADGQTRQELQPPPVNSPDTTAQTDISNGERNEMTAVERNDNHPQPLRRVSTAPPSVAVGQLICFD